MLLLEHATAQPSFHHLGLLRIQNHFHNRLSSISFTLNNEHRIPCGWKSLDKLKKADCNLEFVKLRRGRLLIKGVATLEPKCSIANDERHVGSKNTKLGTNSKSPDVQLESSTEESTELNEREKLRRMRISKANKGNTPWNKGRKHSAETLQRIRERTRLAMQDPKVRMKLVNLGHAQSKETRVKIGIGVRMGWERRRGKKMVQETCYFEWQNLIAKASRQGYSGEEELQWDSYNILDEQLKKEWLESIEQRKTMRKAPGSKRAPKSAEQRRKISEAISAKWSDPDYRERVCSALHKYHGTPIGAERKPRRKPGDGTQSTRSSSIKKKSSDSNIFIRSETKTQNELLRLKRRKSPVYKDPLVSSKLEMIMNIRAERAVSEAKQIEAIERARLLIAEAEKAAKALEVAATKSPTAQASLFEARKLIAEAVQSIKSIETQQMVTLNNEATPVRNDIGTAVEDQDQSNPGEINGKKTLASNNYKVYDDYAKYSFEELLNGEEKLHLESPSGQSVSAFGFDNQRELSSSTRELWQAEPSGRNEGETDSSPVEVELQSLKEDAPSGSHTVITKKWVHGRLIEVVEEA
ncbi:Muscle M-line assembly protein unc-89, putative isoform 2 [Quillaja saponaria]|uniref:Muscle M-line assembly protein unc-89, putative isoform 2 n=1 Tax=Quillaja saponaria TaxID=32244 RepID=A0AAD7L500_QUISA|nr:Muscle M-line assembly protein unc-89, putative isoform 2 [Quillaja saponaria]